MPLNGSGANDPVQSIKPVTLLISEMLTAVSAKVSVLLSYSEQFSGEWGCYPKGTLFKLAYLVKKYGKKYYRTCGGEWMPTQDYGAFSKAKKLYLYL